ncbi:sugar translocase [Vibrio diazotrophicus]|uniref:Sugar translocase n=2 Tax=Vibrionaceae TaxID=641 RepID=A0A2J8I1G0_VIBDI|nr:sugar translocase [Vibrio diazotrophicus]
MSLVSRSNMNTTQFISKEIQPKISLRDIVLDEWKVLIFGIIFTFCSVNIIISGSVFGILPYLDGPFVYGGDSLFTSWYAQRAIEGWVLDNSRSGYPFGSNIQAYPIADSGSFLLLKVFGLLTGSYWKAMNIYFIFGFPLVFFTCYIVTRTFKIGKTLSFVAAVIYAFLPYHFDRINHLLLSFYFLVPVYVYLAYLSYKFPINSLVRVRWTKWLSYTLISIFISSFGVYYTFFGAMAIGISSLLGWARYRSVKHLNRALIFITLLLFGLALNISPALVERWNGSNSFENVVKRAPLESEVYGLKLHQLLVPRQGHRLPQFSSYNSYYSSTSPLVNENITSSFGIVASLGLLLSFLILFFTRMKSDNNHYDDLLYLSLLVLFFVLMSTVGGGGSIFAYNVTPSIRGWNRASVFIAYFCIVILFIIIQLVVYRIRNRVYKYVLLLSMLILVMPIAILDQTTSSCVSCLKNTRNKFTEDKLFVQAIEESLPQGSSVYQLPYMAFPEVPPLFGLEDYQLASGFINSRTLHWSYASIKGSQGDQFFKSLSKEPLSKQVNIVERLGFSGLYVDLRGYENNGVNISKDLTDLLGPPQIVHPRGYILYFHLKGVYRNFKNMSNTQIMNSVGFYVDKHGKRFPLSLEDSYKFNQAALPSYLEDLSGLSQVEDWGRWSDSKLVRFEFFNKLPSKFVLNFTGQAFGPNTGKEMIISVGGVKESVVLLPNVNTYSVEFTLDDIDAQEIQFSIPDPISPRSLGVSSDERTIGVGFIALSINF